MKSNFEKIIYKTAEYKRSFIIAEAGINHNGNLNTAKKLIRSAKKNGADAIKFQTYISEKRTKKSSPLFKIFKKNELKFSNFSILKKYCEKKKILFLSTPFDLESFNYLKKIGCKIFKIASFDISNKKFLNSLKINNATFIISTGMASLKEIYKAVKILEKKKNKVIILHCVSSYPNKEENSHLSNTENLRERFPKNIIGLSDHSKGINVALIAAASGLKIIEKHFMLNNLKCIDKDVSLNEDKMRELNHKLQKINKMFGNVRYGVRSYEKNILRYKKIT